MEDALTPAWLYRSPSCPVPGPLVVGAAARIRRVPDLVINLLSSDGNQTSLQFQYSGGVLPFLVAATIFGAARFERRRVEFSLRVLPGATALAVFSPLVSLPRDVRALDSARVSAERRAIGLGPRRSAGVGDEQARQPSLRAAVHLLVSVRPASEVERSRPPRHDLHRQGGLQARHARVQVLKVVADRLLVSRRDRVAQASQLGRAS